MIVGIVHQQECFNNNGAIFTPEAYQIGENLHYPYQLLRENGRAKGIEICTIDMHPPEKFDMLICFDPPNIESRNLAAIRRRNIPEILVLLESMAVQPNNYNKALHQNYLKVFTWCDDLVDNQKYFLLRLANKIPKELTSNLGVKNNKAVMIAGNKRSKFPNELYSKRLDEIRWCEAYLPEALDLFGMGWDELEFQGILRHLNRFPALRRIAAPAPPPGWKGRVPSKREVLSTYKFSIAYENVAGINGYITEKLFDSLFSLCIPVYWGAPNVASLIPTDCYVDRTTFSTSAEMFNYLLSMSADEYNRRISCIESFVLGEQIHPFSAEHFSNTLLAEIAKFQRT